MKGRLIICLALLAAAGCDDAKSSMGDQPKYKTYRPSEVFADGMSQRPLVFGVVSRKETSDDTGPVPVTTESIARGQQQFDIICSACHGRLGNGDGMIVERGLTRPPSFHIQRLREAPDAHFYDVITNGFGAMFSLNDRITPSQRYEIIAYVRALQAAPDVAGASNDVRQTLIAHGDREVGTGVPK